MDVDLSSFAKPVVKEAWSPALAMNMARNAGKLVGTMGSAAAHAAPAVAKAAPGMGLKGKALLGGGLGLGALGAAAGGQSLADTYTGENNLHWQRQRLQGLDQPADTGAWHDPSTWMNPLKRWGHTASEFGKDPLKSTLSLLYRGQGGDASGNAPERVMGGGTSQEVYDPHTGQMTRTTTGAKPIYSPKIQGQLATFQAAKQRLEEQQKGLMGSQSELAMKPGLLPQEGRMVAPDAQTAKIKELEERIKGLTPKTPEPANGDWANEASEHDGGGSILRRGGGGFGQQPYQPTGSGLTPPDHGWGANVDYGHSPHERYMPHWMFDRPGRYGYDHVMYGGPGPRY